MAAPETTRFIHSLHGDPAKVTSTVRQILSHQIAPPPREASFQVFNKMTFTIDYDGIGKAVPPWMNRLGVLSLASELSSQSVWKSLLEKTSPDIQQDIAQEHDDGVYDLERILALKNANFVTAGITLGLLGAAVGTAIDRCFLLQDQSPLNTTFASEIGRKYPTPAADIDEYMQRVLELVPNPDTTKPDSEGTLLHYLINNDAFKAPRSDNKCPAIYLTRLFFEQWGRQLHTDEEYRERFETTILNGF